MIKKLLLLCLCASAFGPGIAQEKVWITFGSDALSAITQDFRERQWSVSAKRHQIHGEVAIMEVDTARLPVISALMHQQFKRCGGFMVHDSYEAAVAAVAADFTRTTDKMALNYALDRATEVNTVLPDLVEQNIINTITGLSSFTTRYYTTQTAVDAANWLKSEWETIAAGRSDISVDLVNHSWLMPSVVMTITGAHQPQDIIVMGGHLDSINSSGTIAPGADDDASGVATLTEAVRAALANGFVPARTVKIMAYAAEEVGLRGSADLADQAVANGDNVIGVLQLDMTNYKGSVDDIYLMTDYTNSAQNAFVTNLVNTYTGATPNTSSCGYACSDHASWHNRGFAASMPFESSISQYNPTIHTANDTLSVSGNNAVHALKFARLASAYLIEMAKGGLNGDPGPDPGPAGGTSQGTELFKGDVRTGLSGATGAEDRYFIQVPAGASNLSITISGGSGDCDLYTRFGVPPTTSLYDCRPYLTGNNETCSVSSPSTGTYHIMLRGYSSYSGLSLAVNYDAPGGNTAPVAGFTFTTNGLTASFTDTSTDSDGTIASRSWNFGDGGTSSATNPGHTFAGAGTYSVSLTVTDDDGATDAISQNVTVGTPSWVELANTNFESGWGPYSDGGSDCQRSSSDSIYAHQGTYCVRIRDNAGSVSSFFTTGGINLTSYTELTISFWYQGQSMENGENFYVELWNGSQWQILANFIAGTHFTNGTFYHPVVTANAASVNMTSGAKVRFRCDASANDDRIYIDEVVISAR